MCLRQDHAECGAKGRFVAEADTPPIPSEVSTHAINTRPRFKIVRARLVEGDDCMRATHTS